MDMSSEKLKVPKAAVVKEKRAIELKARWGIVCHWRRVSSGSGSWRRGNRTHPVRESAGEHGDALPAQRIVRQPFAES